MPKLGTKAKHYDRHYFESILQRSTRNSKRNRNRLQLIRCYVGQGCLLEIGCGKGNFLRVADEHFTIEGIDISSYVVKSITDLPADHIRRGDIERASLPERAYEVIAAFNVLEHLFDPPPVLEKIRQALREGGLFVGSVPYNGALIGRVHTAITNLLDQTHVSTYRASRWRRLFASAGFREIELFGEVMVGKNWSFYIQNRLWPCLSLNLMFMARK
ncbi:MAG: class I SAM-dependent methyltransferase [Anaerolineales bacterium]